MRSTPIFLLAFFFSTSVFANDSTLSWKNLSQTFKKIIAKSKFINPPISNKFIKTIQVIDLRLDKERIGMYAGEFQNPATEIIFEKNESLETLLIEKITDDKNGTQDILMVIQDLWMTEILPEVIVNPGQQKPIINTSKVICKIDVFIKQNDQFIPLTRVDTTIWDRKKLSFTGDGLLERILMVINDNVYNEFKLNNYIERKKLDKEALQKHYSKKSASAAIADVSLSKGIYRTYKDFRDNKAEPVNFKITNNNNDEPPALYLIDEKGNEVLTRNIWGVNDGKNIFIMQNGFVFDLYKNGNAFYWFGLKGIRTKNVGVPVGVPLGGGWARVGLEPVARIVKFRLTPYLLNLEKGEAY